MAGFGIAELEAGRGRLALCPMPGGAGDYAGDLAAVLRWGPSLVVTMATAEELHATAPPLPGDLARASIAWRHLPVTDFAAESVPLMLGWPRVSVKAREILDGGGRVLVHCRGAAAGAAWRCCG